MSASPLEGTTGPEGTGAPEGAPALEGTVAPEGIDYERLYDYRFRRVDQRARQAVWHEIARYLYRLLGEPACVLDPGAGRGEFINAVPALERWCVDAVQHIAAELDPAVKVFVGDVRSIDLPAKHFDAVFISNLLEHFGTQDEIATFLARMRRVLQPNGRIAVMGPNFRYCSKEYFDFADHTLALTHVAVAEHLHAAGFTVDRIVPRFLPYSFRGRLPTTPSLVRAYLRTPLAWRLLGKQFLVLGTKGDL